MGTSAMAVSKKQSNFWVTFHLSSNFFLFEQLSRNVLQFLATFCNFKTEDFRRFSECCPKTMRTFPQIFEIVRRLTKVAEDFRESSGDASTFGSLSF